MGDDRVDVFAAFYEQFAAAVHGYAVRRSDQQTAEEVTSQVFLVAWRRRERLPADPLPWLYGVARRVLSEQRRAAARRRALGLRLRATAVELQVELELPDRLLSRALGRLSESQREVLLLCYWEDLSPEQLAEVLGCSRATVAVRLHRARKRLGEELQALGDDAETCSVEVSPT